MLTVKFPENAQTLLTSTGKRFMADAAGHGQVQEFTTDHYDLLKMGCVVVEDPGEAERQAKAAEEAERAAAERKLALDELKSAVQNAEVALAAETDETKKLALAEELGGLRARLAALESQA